MSSLGHFRINQQNLLQTIKTCNDDLVQLHKSSDFLIQKNQIAITQDFADAFSAIKRLAKLLNSTERDDTKQLDENESTLSEYASLSSDLTEIQEDFDYLEERHKKYVVAIAEEFQRLADNSRTTLEDAKGLSRDATMFQAVRVAGIRQQHEAFLKSLEDELSVSKQQVNILAEKKSIMANQMALENQRASTSGIEASRQDDKRDTGIIAGSMASGAAAYTTLGVGLFFGPVGWIIGGIAVATSATTTAIYATEKKEKIQRLEKERQNHEKAAANLNRELSEASATVQHLEMAAVEYDTMGREVLGMGKVVEGIQLSAATHEQNMKQWVVKSVNYYLKVSKAVIRMSEVGYSFNIRAELLELISDACNQLELVRPDR